MEKKSGKKVLVTQTRSGNGHPKTQRRTLQALGLGRIGKSAEHAVEQPAVAGMLRTVSHLVTLSRSK